MRTGPAAAERDRRPRPRRRWLRHLLLAASLVVVTLGVVGMHQLSIGHEIVTGPTGSTAHTKSASQTDHRHSHSHSDGGYSDPGGEVVSVAADYPAAHTSAGMTGDGLGDVCPDCADHQMAFGSCLLALTLLVLSWSLIPPLLRHLPPFLLPRLTPTLVGPGLGRLVPPLSLTELSVRRT